MGRAGRDGEPARGLVVHRAEDEALARHQRGGGGPRPATLVRLLHALPAPADDQGELARRTGLGRRTVARAVAALEQAGAVVRSGGDLVAAEGADVHAVLGDVRAERERRSRLEASRVELVRTYTGTTDCRRRLLLELLGEERHDPCGRCDSCDAGTSVPARAAAMRPGQLVRHAEFGPGTVSVVEHDRVTVLFEDRGYVTLDAEIALDAELLQLR